MHHHYDARRSTPGWPDLVLLRAPEAIFAEVKTDTGKLTVDQRTVIDRLVACGCEAVVWRPADWPAVVDRLRRKVAHLDSISSHSAAR